MHACCESYRRKGKYGSQTIKGNTVSMNEKDQSRFHSLSKKKLHAQTDRFTNSWDWGKERRKHKEKL